MRIIALNSGDDWYGVYWPGRRGKYSTSLMFDGTLDECIAYTRGH